MLFVSRHCIYVGVLVLTSSFFIHILTIVAVITKQMLRLCTLQLFVVTQNGQDVFLPRPPDENEVYLKPH